MPVIHQVLSEAWQSGPAEFCIAASVRRLRRKLPNATIVLGCWMKEMDPAALAQLRDGAKADLAAGSLANALKLCIESAEAHSCRHTTEQHGASGNSAA